MCVCLWLIHFYFYSLSRCFSHRVNTRLLLYYCDNGAFCSKIERTGSEHSLIMLLIAIFRATATFLGK